MIQYKSKKIQPKFFYINKYLFLSLIISSLFLYLFFFQKILFLNLPAKLNIQNAQAAISRPSFAGVNFYYGDLHAHSGYSSDGYGTPESAYDSAKNNSNDFFALTDHDEAFIENPYLCLEGINNAHAGSSNFTCQPDKLIYVGTEKKWENLKTVAANKNTDGEFVALYGYEWTHTGGHANIFEAPTFINLGYAFSNVYAGLANHPNKNTLFAMFNHPMPNDFNDFQYDRNADNLFSMIETNNFANKYPIALKQGWKVGATGYGDGHAAPHSGSRRYGIVSAELTKESIIEAIKNRHTFAVLEGRAGSNYFPLALGLKINETLMGGTVSFNNSITYEIFVQDNLRPIDKVKLIYGGNYPADYYLAKEFKNLGNSKTITGEFNDFIFSMPERAKYFYIEIYQTVDGVSRATGWSSPVFLHYNPNLITPTPTSNPVQPTLTPTPTPATTLTCGNVCSFGAYQCKRDNNNLISENPGGKCQVNSSCPGIGSDWRWSYCWGSMPTPTATSAPTATPAPSGTPLPTSIPNPTPTPATTLTCGNVCSFGAYQCKRDNNELISNNPGGRCQVNSACPGTGNNWRWSYCWGSTPAPAPTATPAPSGTPLPTSIPNPTPTPATNLTCGTKCSYGPYQCQRDNNELISKNPGGKCQVNSSCPGTGSDWRWSYCY